MLVHVGDAVVEQVCALLLVVWPAWVIEYGLHTYWFGRTTSVVWIFLVLRKPLKPGFS